VNARPEIHRYAAPPTVAELRDAYLRSAAGDSQEALDALLAERPDCVPAHLLRVAKPVVAKDLQAFPALERALRDAEPHLRRAGEQARLHAAAATAWLAHRPLHAAHIYSTISANDARDLLALRLAQSCWFFLGRRQRLHAVAERALRLLQVPRGEDRTIGAEEQRPRVIGEHGLKGCEHARAEITASSVWRSCAR